MLETPWLMAIDKRLWGLGILLLVLIALEVVRAIQDARRNHLLRSILGTLELNPEVKFERRLAAAEKRVAR